MLFKRKTKEMKVRNLTPEETLDIECQATNCIPTAGELKRIMEKAENDSESFFYNTVTRRINGLIYSQANKGNNHISFGLAEVTTFKEREEHSFYSCYKWMKKYYSLVGLKVDCIATWVATTYTIEWER